MQIHVRVSKRSDEISEQVRAYAEYRIFSAIAGTGSEVAVVAVHLSTREIPHIGRTATCIVSVRLLHQILRVKARSTYPAAAIDMAAARLADAIALEPRTARP
jgi:ribosome-associated translation inhibitor RaiA